MGEERSQRLARLIARIDELVAAADKAVGPSPYEAGNLGDWPEWHRRRRAAFDRIAAELAEAEGARINQEWDGARIRMAGIASSSTSGLPGALRNWQRAARKRLEASDA